jgi:ATP-dependent helicase HrpA
LTQTLASSLQAISGQRIQAGDFELEKLPASLRMSYRVTAKGKKVDLSNDLESLKAKHRELGRAEVAKVATKLHVEIERQDLQTWDFDQIPLKLTTVRGNNQVDAYPALVLRSGKVNLEVQATQKGQFDHHRFGVAELIRREIPSPAKYVESHLKPEEKLAISHLPYQGFGKFVDDVILALALKEIVDLQPEGLIANRSQFEQVRDQVQAKVLEVIFDTVATCTKISEASRAALRAISNAKAIDFLNELSAEKQHVEQLLTQNFVSLTGLDQLSRLPVYLRAVELRIMKLQENPNRDRLAQVELNQALHAFENAGGVLPLAKEGSAHLVRARWLLEELRVSLFAQTLGASESVSVQRINKVLKP